MKITAVFDDTNTSLVSVTIDNNGIKKTKSLHFSDFVKLLGKSERIVENQYTHLGQMPDGYIDGYISSTEDMTGRIAIFVPAAIQRMAYENGKDSILVPYPSLILIFSFKKGKLEKTCAFSTKAQKITQIHGDTVLYRYPYGNVSPMSGAVCWGQNRFNAIQSWQEINQLVNQFITSPTNSDLYQAGTSTSLKVDLIELLRIQSSKSYFDEDILITTKRTLAECLS